MAYQSEIEKLEQRYRENPDQWFAALADSYRKAGSLDLALDVVQAGLGKRPNYVSGHIVLGRCLLQKPDDVAANQAFEKVLALDAENVIALKALSEISERAGRSADAQRWLTRLLEVDPMNEEAEQALAKLKEAASVVPGSGAEAVGAVEPVQVAPPEQVAPVAGFEATVAEARPSGPAVQAPPQAPPQAPAAAAPAAEEPAFTIEKSVEATAQDERKVPPEALQGERRDASAPPAGGAPGAGAQALEPVEFEPPAPETTPHEAGVESMAFEPPSAADLPPAPPDLEPMEFEPPPAGGVAQPADLGAQPFDGSLGWGTGERRSAQISQADVEAAEQAHEPTLTPVVSEPEASTDLPLIFPDEGASGPPQAPAPAAREAESGGTEPEPVLTETMAELYAKQGLVAEARDIYRKLVAQRPGDSALAARLAALEGPAAPRRGAAQTGGPSARDFLTQVFGGEMSAPRPEAPAAASTTQGAPTRRASDDISLASVFGEDPSTAAEPASAPGAGAKAPGQGFSFDEFFGAARSSEARPSSASDSGGGGDEDDFKRWLKGLKS